MKTRFLATILVLGALAWLLWPSSQNVSDENPLHTQLIDRAWIDHMPHYADEKIDLLFLDGDSQVGVFQNMSVYEGDYSLFAWRNRTSDSFDLTMLQHRKNYRMKYRVSSRDCGDFDLCMVVGDAPRGAKKYYSMKDWGQIDSSDAAATRIRALLDSKARAEQ